MRMRRMRAALVVAMGDMIFGGTRSAIGLVFAFRSKGSRKIQDMGPSCRMIDFLREIE
jgi:NaMN:DMB phosphoribosyltransferase